MSTKGKRPMRALTAGDKIEAIQRVNDGESKASVARDIGVPESTLRGWCKNEDKLRYMSSRHSTPDKDKLTDEPMEKKARYSPIQQQNSGDLSQEATLINDTENCLDLSNGERNHNQSPKLEKPIELINAETAANKLGAELNKAKADLSRYGADFMSSCLSNDLKATDLGAAMSMSAMSPLANLNHLNGIAGLNPNHMGMSFNDIATNLSLIAQLNPTLNALTNSMSSSAKTLRSIRSPKPSQLTHNTALNLSDKNKNGKSEVYLDKPRVNPFQTALKDMPVDDPLWYWMKTQQAMIDLTARSGQLPPHMHQPICPPKSRSPKEPVRNSSPKPIAPVAPLTQQMDKNTWLWQYYKQIGGALPLPEDKPKTASQVPKDNILYSHLTKESSTDVRQDVIKLSTETDKDALDKSNAKARNVLDNLLYNNNNVNEKEEFSNLENEVDADAEVALEHGEKFLCWLEKCRDPSVTQMRVHQLRSLLDNIKAGVQQRLNHSPQRISRRK